MMDFPSTATAYATKSNKSGWPGDGLGQDVLGTYGHVGATYTVTFSEYVPEVTNLVYYFHDHYASGTWTTRTGTMGGPTGGFDTNYNWTARYLGDTGPSCEPWHPFMTVGTVYFDGQLKSATNTLGTNLVSWFSEALRPVTNLSATVWTNATFTNGVGVYTNQISLTNVVSGLPAGTGTLVEVDLSPLGVWLSALRDSINSNNNALAQKQNAAQGAAIAASTLAAQNLAGAIDNLRKESAGASVVINSTIGSGVRSLYEQNAVENTRRAAVDEFNSTNVWQVNIRGGGTSNGLTSAQMDMLLTNGWTDGVWSSAMSRVYSMQPVYDAMAGDSTNVSWAAIQAAQSNLNSSYIALLNRGTNFGTNPTFFLREWASVWAVDFGCVWFGTECSRIGFNVNGTSWLKVRETIAWVRTCMLWLLHIAYWLALLRLHMWLYSGAGVPLPGTGGGGGGGGDEGEDFPY